MKRPIWVEVGLFTLRTREQAISYLVAASVGSVLVFIGTIVVSTILLGSPLVYALVKAALLGGMLAVAALWYWLSIRWMDTHNRW
jgi:hypothetical protein